MKRRPKGAPKKKGGKMPIKKLIKEVQALVANVKELVNKDSAAVKVSPNFNFIQNDPAANSSLIKNMPPPSARTEQTTINFPRFFIRLENLDKLKVS